MSDLTIFEIVAGTASILALLLAVIGSARKTLRTYKQKRQSAEQELEKELARLQAAGGTVSARSDLGFLVLIELGSLRESSSSYRHLRALYLVVAAFMLLATILFRGYASVNVALLATNVALVLGLASTIMSLLAHFTLMRLERYTDSYERRIKEVWARPVYRRSDTSVGPTTGSAT